eukprot:764690-Hanusia_phi.AAC.5
MEKATVLAPPPPPSSSPPLVFSSISSPPPPPSLHSCSSCSPPRDIIVAGGGAKLRAVQPARLDGGEQLAQPDVEQERGRKRHTEEVADGQVEGSMSVLSLPLCLVLLRSSFVNYQ